MSFASGDIPVYVVPVHKKGEKSQVPKNRPISLLCLVSQVMEIYIYNNVYKVVEILINTNQHGFMNEKSCTTQLLTVYDEIGKHFDKGKQTDMICLDFSKAFDSVDHNMVIHNYTSLVFLVNYFCGLANI